MLDHLKSTPPFHGCNRLRTVLRGCIIVPTGFTYLRPVHPGEMLSISFRPKVHVHNFVQPWTAFRSAAKCALRLAQPNDGCRRSVGASCRRIRQQRFALDAADARVSAPTALSSYGLLTDAVDGSCFNEPRYLCAARGGQPLRLPVADRRGALPRCCWRFGTGAGEPLAGAQHGAAWPPCAALRAQWNEMSARLALACMTSAASQ